MVLLLLKDGKLLNRVVVPDSWPHCEDPWYPDPAAGLTWEVDKGQSYERHMEPPLPPDPFVELEKVKARGIEALLAYVAKQPDAPQDVLDWAAAKGTAGG